MVQIPNVEQEPAYQARVPSADASAVPVMGPPLSPAPAANQTGISWPAFRAALRGGDQPVSLAAKGLALTITLCLAAVLAAYAGVLGVLPLTPPALQLTDASQRLAVRAVSYCWFTAGASTCVDPTPDSPPVTNLPVIHVVHGAPLVAWQVRFGYPAPSTCVATSGASTGAQGLASHATPLRVSAAGVGVWSATWQLIPPASVGTYQVSIACTWNPHRSLRWLQGLGHATYTLAVQVGES